MAFGHYQLGYMKLVVAILVKGGLKFKNCTGNYISIILDCVLKEA